MPLDKNILKKKIFGVPVPIIAVGAGVVGVIAYRKFGGGGGGDGAGADGAATPADYSGGSAGSGGSASDYSGGTGDYGSGADLGLGSGGGGFTLGGGGEGGFLPATDAGGLGLQPIINKTIRIIRPASRGRRIKIINRVVVNPKAIAKNKRRPNVVHGDRPVPSPTNRNPRGAGSKVVTGQKPRPKTSPPIIRRKTPARR